MTSKRFKFATWKGTLRSALVVVGLYGAGVFAWNALFVPHFSGLRLGEPALVKPAELWRIGQHGEFFRYGTPGDDTLIIAGDSRVQRGIVLEEFREEGLGPVVALTRPAGRALDLLRLVDENLPARAVICLSPLGLYNELDRPLAEFPKKGRFTRRFDKWSGDRADMLRRRIAEPMLPPAWRYGWYGGFDQDKYFEAFRTSFREETRAARLGKLQEAEQFLIALKNKGWRIECVRIPTYGPMRAIEDEGFDPQLFVEMCARVGVPYKDYGTVENATSDGSHLGVAGARAFSEELARDLKQAQGMLPKR